MSKCLSQMVLGFLKKVRKALNVKMFISDGARENTSGTIAQWMKAGGVKHHVTSPHHPESNGRIERFNQTLLQSLYKLGKQGLLKARLGKVIAAYNSSFHEGIGMTPLELKKEENWNPVKRRQFEEQLSKYEKYFARTEWPAHKAGDLVLIKDEIHKQKGQPVFRERGQVTESQEFDTYLIKKEYGGTVKRHASQVRAIAS